MGKAYEIRLSSVVMRYNLHTDFIPVDEKSIMDRNKEITSVGSVYVLMPCYFVT